MLLDERRFEINGNSSKRICRELTTSGPKRSSCHQEFEVSGELADFFPCVPKPLELIDRNAFSIASGRNLKKQFRSRWERRLCPSLTLLHRVCPGAFCFLSTCALSHVPNSIATAPSCSFQAFGWFMVVIDCQCI